jgi:hypothetical protein
MLLADELVERAGTHPISQRACAVGFWMGCEILKEAQFLFHHGESGAHREIEKSLRLFATRQF